MKAKECEKCAQFQLLPFVKCHMDHFLKFYYPDPLNPNKIIGYKRRCNDFKAKETNHDNK